MKELNSVFKIVIVHDDLISAIQAVEMLKRLAERLESEHGIGCNIWQTINNIWKFDWLEDPELWEQVVANTIEADMIIISAGSSTELPACVRNWIEKALPRKQGEPTALVALIGGERKNRSESSQSGVFLRQMAQQFGFDFFCNLDHQPAL
ncbi:MAG TPA: hypothetical protein VGI03_14920 [Verrucomicrobiae bacterium]|jgi:hypothetical protein